MDHPKARWDLWTLPAYLLWLAFFVIGFDPEWAYLTARDVGFVVSQNALVNSPHVITLALAGYYGVFAYQRCIECGLRKADAQTQGVQFGILGLIAFLAFSPFELTGYADIPVAKLRFIILLVGGTKLFMWFLLLGVVARYYLLGHTRVFVGLAGAAVTSQDGDEAGPVGKTSSVAWIEGPPGADRRAELPAAPSRPEAGNDR